MKTSLHRLLSPRLWLAAFCLAGALLSGDSALAAIPPTVNPSTAALAVTATTLTISGSGFDSTPANNNVLFNDGAVGIVTIAATNSLTVTFSTPPVSTGSLTAVVTTDGASNSTPVQVAVVVPLAQFAGSSESVNATAGTFSIPVTLTGNPTFASGVTPTSSTFASGFQFANFLAFDSVGNLYVSDPDTGSVSKVTPAGVLSTYASGLNFPAGLAFDTAGNLYVANYDQNENGLVSKVTPAGVISTFASGFTSPAGLAFDAAGNLYVASSIGNTVSAVTPSGAVSTFATGFSAPVALAFDAAGNLYVANTGNGSVSKVTPGGVVSTFASGLAIPSGLAFDSAGNLYVAHNVKTGIIVFELVIITNPTTYGQISVVSPAGVVSTLDSGLSPTDGLAIDTAGNLYVAFANIPGTVSKLSPTALVPFTLGGTAVNGVDYSGVTSSPLTFVNGQPTVFITGTLRPDPGTTPTLTLTLGTPSGALLHSPSTNSLTIAEPPPSVTPSAAGLAINAPSIVINGIFNPVAANNTVTFNDGAIGTVTGATATSLTVTFTTPPTSLGNLTATVTSDGLSTGAPVQVAAVVPGVTATTSALGLNATTLIINGGGFDPIAANNTVTLSNGAVGTVTSATATQLTVSLTTLPTSPGVLAAIVTTDGQSSGPAVPVATMVPLVQFSVGSESVNAAAGTFSIPVTLTANPTFDNGVPPLATSLGAEFFSPTSLAVDSAHNLYVANIDGTVTQTVPAGAHSTFVSGFTAIQGLACDAAGNLYVADSGPKTVSKVTPDGVVSIFAFGFNTPAKLAFDAAGNLYVGDSGNGTVSKVTPSGVASTFASGFSAPNGLAFDKAGNLYVANGGNGIVSEVTPGGAVSTFASGFGAPAGLGFDVQGNLYILCTTANGIVKGLIAAPSGIIIIGNPPQPHGTISEVTPTGVVSTFAAGILSPTDLISDAAGNLYITDLDVAYNEFGGHDSLVTEYSPTVIVPFTVGGTAVDGVDYSGVSSSSGWMSSTLTFIAGQPTVYITGTLLPDAGATPTLTFTLGTPSGAVLGSPTTNTLTIVEPAPSVTASTTGLAINATSIVINGNFSPVAANNRVTFSDGAVGTVTSASATSLTVAFTTPPTSLGNLTATVTSNGVSTGAPVQVGTVVPGVISTGSTVGLNVTTLTINGFGFDPIAANNTVVLSNGAAGTVTAATATQLTVSLSNPPAATGNISAIVTTDGLSSGLPVTVATVEPYVQFSAGSESVNALAGTFSIAVTLTSNPTFDGGVSPAVTTFASGFPFAYYAPSSLVFDSTGNLCLANGSGGVVNKVTPGGVVSTVASGFSNLSAIAIDPTGNLYLASFYDGTVSKVTPGGATSLFASGFNSPQGMTCDAAGNLYIANVDSNYNGIISKVTPGGAVSTYASGLGSPQALVFDAAGNLYVVANTDSGSVLSKITPGGAIIPLASGFNDPSAMTIDAAGNLYVTNLYGSTISKVTPGGNLSTLASGLDYPQGLAADSAGNLYVVVLGNGSGTIDKLSPTALVPFTLGGTAIAGTDYSGVTASPLTFVNGQPTVYITGTLPPDPGATPTLTFTLGTPSGAILGSPTVNTLTIVEPLPSVTLSAASLAINAPSIVINGFFSPVAADNTVTFNDGAIGTVTSASTTSLTVTFSSLPMSLGTLTATVTSNGVSTGAPVQVATVVPGVTFTASAISFNSTTVTISGSGFDPIATNNTVIFSNGAVGIVTAATATQLTVSLTVAPTSTGALTAIVTTDGFSSGLAVPIAVIEPTAQFSAGSESVNATTGTFSIPVTLTGNPTFAGGASAAISALPSLFYYPQFPAFDAAGNLYVANWGSDSVSKVALDGSVSTFASGFSDIACLAFDAAGNLYVSDFGGGGRVMKVTPSQVVSTFVSGLSSPDGMAFDAAGNLYVSSANYNGSVSKITPGGVVTTFVSGIVYPNSLAFDAAGNLYVASSQPNIVSKVTPSGAVSTFASGFNYPAGLAFDAAGNLYVVDGNLDMVTPSGAVSTIASGFYNPSGLAIDTAGNLYVANFYYDTISKVSPVAIVPFTLGGTAASGLDYSGLTASPLTFLPGQTTAYITGTLPPDPGATPTLTFTLGTPTGAVLGNPTANTLTIVEPSASVTSSTVGLAINASSIVIHGIFNPVVANNAVTFNDGAVGTVTNASTSALTVTFTTTPTSLGSLTATVTSNGSSTGAPVQVATVMPVVTSANAFLSLNATTLTINGFGFDPVAANNTVIFSNGAAGTVTSATATQLTITLTTPPTSTGYLTAIVTTDGVSSGVAVPIATLDPVVQFSVGSESVDATTGAFSLTVTLTGNPTFPSGASPTPSTLALPSNSYSQFACDAVGNLYFSNYQASTVNKMTPDGVVSTLASGLNNPGRVTLDPAGNLYVVGSYGSTVIRIAPDGSVSTFASGFADIGSLAFDTVGNLYVGDAGTGQVTKVTTAGVVGTFASGLSYGYMNAMSLDAAGNLYLATAPGTITKVTPAGAASIFASFAYNYIDGLAVGSDGNLYVSAGYSNTVNKVTPAGVVSTFATLPNSEYYGNLAFDGAGNLYVDTSDYTGANTIIKFSPMVIVPFTVDGTAVAGTDYSGVTSGPLTFVGGQGTAYITGTLTPNPGTTPTLTFTLGTPTGAGLGNPTSNALAIVEPPPSVIPSTAGLAINASSIVINGIFNPVVAHNSVVFNDGAVGTVTSASSTSLTVAFTTPPTNLGALTATVTSNGLSTGAPVQVATIAPGVTFTNSSISLNATTLAINGFGFDPIAAHNTVTFSNGAVGTVTAATATQLTVSLTTAPTSTGILTAIVTTDGDSTGAATPIATVLPVAQFGVTGESVSSSAGSFSVAVTLSGAPIFAGGASPAVSTFISGLTGTGGLAFDTAGNLYNANYFDDTVNKVTPGGVVSTFASGLASSQNLAIDAAGNLYVDGGFSSYAVSKITPDGVVSTFATGLPNASGLALDTAGNLYVGCSSFSYTTYTYVGTVNKVTPDGAVSTFASGFSSPSALAFDTAGNLYVADSETNTVSKVTPGGVVSPFASGFNVPDGLAFDTAGNLYVSNGNTDTVSKITSSGVVSTFVSGLNYPDGLAFDTAGNLYVSSYDQVSGRVISKISPTAIVPFTVGGTAVADTDYSGLSAGPVTFVNGQSIAYITGTLIPHSGAPATLTFSLGSPSGAVLGSPTVNTLTIWNSPIVTSNTANLAANATTITINGFGFDPTAAHNTVWFSDGAVGTVTAATPTQLTVQLSHAPAGLGALAVVVTTNGVSSGAATQIATVNTMTSITSVAMSGGTITLNFTGAPNTTYGLQYTSSLSGSSWSYVSPVTTNGNGTGQYVGTPPPGSTGFYQLVYPAP